MHHFKAKGGTHFNFNSDMSGEVQIHREPDDAQGYVDGADLLEFVRWYQADYGANVSVSREQLDLITAGIANLERQRDDAIRVAVDAVESAKALLALAKR